MSEQDNVIGTVLKGKELVAYQQGSVVSRTLITKEFGTVTAFAFDKGQGLSEHTAPFDALVHIIDGKAQVNISGQPHQLQEGEMIIMPADKPHSLQAIECFKMMLIMVKK